MSKPLNVLLIEDCEDDAELVCRLLKRSGYAPAVRCVMTAAKLNDALRDKKWDIIISDYSLPRLTAPEALRIVQQAGVDTPFLVVSGTVSEEMVIETMKAGAHDYVMKDNLTRLAVAVDRELREAEARREVRRLEEQFRQAQKMEAIGRLAGGVAHDFNNLLTIITGFAQLALLEPNNPAQTGLEQIVKAAERAAALTRQLLAFSRQQALDPRIFDLNELVQGIEEMLRRLIGADVEIETRLAAERVGVRADPNQMEQVILNLVVNARDAMPNGGTLTIETGIANLDHRSAKYLDCPAGRYCLLAVSDTGTGMNPETLARAFEPFFTTKGEGKGTGLGLSTVYGIVKQSGGTIKPRSELGAGTTIKIYLPSVTEEGLPDNSAEKLEPLPTGSEAVLVVEDDGALLDLIDQVLTASGFHVLRAIDVNEAVSAFENGRSVDLLLSDLILPKMSGPALASQMRQARPGLKTLYMSGYPEESILLDDEMKNSAAFIQKPFTPGGLVRKVREVLDSPPC